MLMLPQFLRRILDERGESQPDASREAPDRSGPSGEAIADQSKRQQFTALLERHGGQMKQSEVVANTDWSQATVSRVLSEMAEDGIIRKISVGRQNLITLIGHEPDWYDAPRNVDEGASDSWNEDDAILLVEDDRAEARLFEEALREGDIAAPLHVVQDGSEAVEFILQRGQYEDAPRPAVVLLDLSLKVIDGIDVLRELDEHDAVSDVPVIVLSNSDARTDIQTAYANGAAGYIVKPDTLSGRVDLVEAIESFWLTHVVTPDAMATDAGAAGEGASLEQPTD